MDTLVQKRIDAELFVDGVAGVITQDQTAKHCYGLPNEQSLFEIGSITKTFTGILFAELVNEGKLHPEDLVSDHILALQGSYVGGVTLAQLATHTSVNAARLAGYPRSLCQLWLGSAFGLFEKGRLLLRISRSLILRLIRTWVLPCLEKFS